MITAPRTARGEPAIESETLSECGGAEAGRHNRSSLAELFCRCRGARAHRLFHLEPLAAWKHFRAGSCARLGAKAWNRPKHRYRAAACRSRCLSCREARGCLANCGPRQRTARPSIWQPWRSTSACLPTPCEHQSVRRCVNRHATAAGGSIRSRDNFGDLASVYAACFTGEGAPSGHRLSSRMSRRWRQSPIARMESLSGDGEDGHVRKRRERRDAVR
jgi:hypothetical protein